MAMADLICARLLPACGVASGAVRVGHLVHVVQALARQGHYHQQL